MSSTLRRSVRNPASFRDPSGFVFVADGVVHRQVNEVYRQDYDLLRGSGLHDELVSGGQLLPCEEVDGGLAAEPGAYRVLRPEPLELVSYPYEWCWSQLKDAALLTLAIQRRALARGLSLKDASAYNVQFHRGRVVFIDTLSFERLREGEPWVAYRQFCQHFLAPLALMSLTDIRLGQLLQVHLDGIPLGLAAKLLPWRTKLSLSLGLHLHAHARAQQKHAGSTTAPKKKSGLRFSKRAFEGLIDSLEAVVSDLSWNPHGGEWTDYYQTNNNYGRDGLEQKELLLRRLVGSANDQVVWDLGANTGRMSRVARAAGAKQVLSWDIDPTCVEANYRELRRAKETGLFPLLLDLTNPTPAIGWANEERKGALARGPADVVLALGLVHHLCISNNVPMGRVAALFASIGRTAVVEWVPKEDSQVQRLLATRADIFDTYDQPGFEAAIAPYFTTVEKSPVVGTARTLYHLRAR